MKLNPLSPTIPQIVTNVVVQVIILLYLIDNNEQTSWMILMGSGVGVLIEAWKVCLLRLGSYVWGRVLSCLRQITKAVDISVTTADPGSVLPLKLVIKGSHLVTMSSGDC